MSYCVIHPPNKNIEQQDSHRARNPASWMARDLSGNITKQATPQHPLKKNIDELEKLTSDKDKC